MNSSHLAQPLALALALSVVLMGACGGTTGSVGTGVSPPSDKALAIAVKDGRVSLIGSDAKESAHLDVPGLVDGYSVQNGGSVVLVGADDVVWEITVTPKLAARKIGKVTLPKAHRECLRAEGDRTNSAFIQSWRGVALAKGASDTLCLTFSDRNVNMMDAEITAAMGLKKATLKSSITYLNADSYDEGTCGAKAAAVCSSRLPTAKRFGKDARWSVPKKAPCTLYDAKTKRSVDLRPLLKQLPVDAKTEICEADGAFVNGDSASGRYLALMHDRQQEDYIHFTLTVFDMGTGTATPKALYSTSAVGEARIDWATADNAVIIEGTLLVLGDKTSQQAVGTGGLFLEWR